MRRNRVSVLSGAVLASVSLLASGPVAAQSSPVGLLEAAAPSIERLANAMPLGTLATQAPPASAWAAVRSLPVGAKVRVDVRVDIVQAAEPGSQSSAARIDTEQIRGSVTAVTSETLSVLTSTGVRALARNEIERIRVPDTTRRILYGVIGVAGGALAGYFVCPQCANEGSVNRAPLALAAAGSSLFLLSPSRTIYRHPERDPPN